MQTLHPTSKIRDHPRKLASCASIIILYLFARRSRPAPRAARRFAFASAAGMPVFCGNAAFLHTTRRKRTLIHPAISFWKIYFKIETYMKLYMYAVEYRATTDVNYADPERYSSSRAKLVSQ
eukprot:6207590-Pleurochrysis_carterae.AAC.4